jgi:hypothetical protein
MQKKSLIVLVFALSAVVLFSCKEEEEDMAPMQNFKVTIENVFEPRNYFVSGITEAVGPGGSYSFSFNAGKGHSLSLATMFVQSNDLFYAPSMDGIALYDQSGNPVTGDITSLVNLWDAGTEGNEEPGTGANQAPRQSGPNTGMTEGENVMLISDVNDGFTYPNDEEVIKLSLAHDGGSKFTLTIDNISDAGAFQTPLAPGSWVVHSEGQTPIFKSGSMASSGLENLAEDGNNGIIAMEFEESSGYISPFAPGAFSVFMNDNPLFMDGKAASSELEALAEDGNPTGFMTVFNTPVGGSSPAPIFPGDSYEFMFSASDGDQLSFATMLVQSNDLFIGTQGLSLYSNGQAVSGDVTSNMTLWDAYKETNEFPGAGNYQAPRQSGPNMGMDENGSVQVVNDGFSYPSITEMIKVTISPM